ncbi:AMP deaminase-like protein [Tanacetum coccineum]
MQDSHRGAELHSGSLHMSAKDVLNHYYLWEDGTYLEFMQHVSNAIEGKDGDKALLSEIEKCKSDVFDSNWKVDEPWHTKMNAAADYKDTKIDELLRLVRNASSSY